MDTVSPTLVTRSAAPGPALVRALTPEEWSHLERLREWLRRDGTDAADATALDDRWARLLETHPTGAPAPAGVIAALAVAVGDLLVAAVEGTTWRMCPGPDGATPGVLLEDRPTMPVLPVLDAHARWRTRVPGWTVDYVERAAAHLLRARPQVPSPRRPPEDVPVADATPEESGVPTNALGVPWAPGSPVADEAAAPDGPTAHLSPDVPGTGTAPVATQPQVPSWANDPAPATDAEPADTVAAAPVATGAEAYVPQAFAPGAYDPEPHTSGAPALGTAGVPVVPSMSGDRPPLTPDDLPHRPSERVQDLALRALELALERATSSSTGSAPFVLVREQHDVGLVEFEASDAGLAQAREHARSAGYSAAAVAWTSPAGTGRPFARVVVDASSTGRPGIRVAHAFAHDELGGREVGGPEVVGQCAPVL